jgi:hypothetical protein
MVFEIKFTPQYCVLSTMTAFSWRTLQPRCLFPVLNKGASCCINEAIFQRSSSNYAVELKISASNYIPEAAHSPLFSACVLLDSLSRADIQLIQLLCTGGSGTCKKDTAPLAKLAA